MAVSRLLIFGVVIGALTFSCKEHNSRPPNILFIAVDDLRPQLGSYGEEIMVTPNLDRLAGEGRLFMNHFVQVPTCGASRYSMLTGRRPFLPRHLSNEAIRVEMADRPDSVTTVSWPRFFREKGYRTLALGKVSHYPDSRIYSYSGDGDGRPEMPHSWDDTWGPVGKWGTSWNAFFGYADGSNRNTLQRDVLPYEKAEATDEDLPDGLIAAKAVETLRQLATSDRPFLLAVGFFKPHLPFTAPEKYWELYDRERIGISPNPGQPESINASSIHNSGELFGNYRRFPEKGGAGIRISDENAKLLRHAYYASVSYVDAQVGKVLAALRKNDLADNTIIVVWGDHGWHLGDHTVWGKHTNFDRSLRSALLMHFPGQEFPGKATEAVVESVDIYPTLVEACGFEVPSGLDGQSLLPVMKDPSFDPQKPAISYFRGAVSLRDPRYRLTWYPNADTLGFELYDHEIDPFETKNIAEHDPDAVERLKDRMDQYYTGIYE